ncbi:MAG: hypothetical protein E7524_01150 [Ruminococcaceae bacterium]|nr:hypothetical protein [Oscillospiraceae bacterium]
MSYDIYNYIFIGSLVLAIVMLAVTVLLYFVLNIKGAIGDVTGKTKRKAIEDIHNTSAAASTRLKKTTKKTYNPEDLSESARLAAESVETSKISVQDRFDHFEAGQTTALDTEEASATTVLSNENAGTTILNNTASETTVLSDNGSTDTTVLDNSIASETTVLGVASNEADPDFVIEIDITYVHSNEVIR